MKQPTIIATDEEAREDDNCYIGAVETPHGWLVAHYFRWTERGAWQRDVSDKILLTMAQIDKLHALVHQEESECK